MELINTILGVIFPPKCLICGKSGTEFCFVCLVQAPPAERESASWIFPLFDYRHPAIKKSLSLLKYKGKRRLANIFAEMIYAKISEELSELSVMENFTEPILIPIPLSKKRYRERGFNQAELICRELVKIDAGKSFILITNILLKPHDTEHQARIRDRSQRLKNISGSFTVKNADLVKNRNIILIDDILTTGATLSEARKVLRAAGARKVIAFTVAH
jgi:competence protein ComFC